MTESKIGFEHSIEMSARNSLVVSGVVGVVSFDDSQICVTLCSGEYLYVEGSGLDIKEVNLQKGILEADGRVSGLFYEDSGQKSVNGGLFKRLFRKA